jgi:hypothetical protein
MGLTLAQAKLLGLEKLHPAMTRGRSAERELLDRLALESHPESVRAAVESDGMNKLERSFRDDVLEPAWRQHRIARYWREPVKLRLAGRCYFSPDFMAELPPGEHGLPPELVLIEVKGGWFREDAKLKVRVAASDYPCFGWLLVFREGRRGWRCHRVTSRDISREPVIVPWIHGLTGGAV